MVVVPDLRMVIVEVAGTWYLLPGKRWNTSRVEAKMNDTTSAMSESSRAAIAVATTTSTAQARVVLCLLAT